MSKLVDIEIDQLCKVLLSGDHAAIVMHHASALKSLVNLCLLFSVLDDAWETMLMGIVQYTEKHGKTPNVQGVMDYMGRSGDAFFSQAIAKTVELEGMLPDVEVLTFDPAVLIEHVIHQVNLAAFKEISMNSYAIATGTRIPAQCLGMKKPSGFADAQTYFNLGCSKLVGNLHDVNGMWHENTDAIVATLNEQDKGAIIQTLLRGMDDNWNLKLGKTLLIAGTSGDGKSTLMLSLLYNFALQGLNIILFTLEDPQVDVWVKLAFIHTARFKSEFELPSLFEWEYRANLEKAGKHPEKWLTPEERSNMRDVILSIRHRDKVPGLIDVQEINEWSKMKSYVQSHMEENKYSIMAVDYFSDRMATPQCDARYKDKEVNAAAGDAINFAKDNNMLLVTPVQVKKNLRDAYAAEYVDDIQKNTGFIAPYDDIAAVKADQYPALPQGADYCIGVWSGDVLKKKNQGLLCCMKFRPTQPFPCFRLKMEPKSKYVREAQPVSHATERSIELSAKHALAEEL